MAIPWIGLVLTSPLMTDAKVHKLGGSPHQVTYAQTLLKDRSKDFYCDPGTIDGQWGLHSHNATLMAKHYMGYVRPTGQFGQDIALYLSKDKKRTWTMRVLGHRRIKKHKKKLAQKPKRQKALEIGLAKIGSYGSENNEFARWYGEIGEWCAMFGSWCSAHAGMRQFKPRDFVAYCPYVTADAIYNRNGLSVTHEPEPGDIVIFHWLLPGMNPMGDHFGRFDGWIDRAAGTFWSLEGNTTNDVGIGNCVVRKERETIFVVHFVRVAE